MANALVKHKSKVKGRAQLGVQAFADALLVIPKVFITSGESKRRLYLRRVLTDLVNGFNLYSNFF